MDAGALAEVNQKQGLDNIRGMKGWLKFIGIVTIVSGALQALSLVGIVWAWLPIWLGVLMLQAGNRGGQYVERGDPADFAAFTGKLKVYFIVSGVVLIVSLALTVLTMILVALSFLGTFSLPFLGALMEKYQQNQ